MLDRGKMKCPAYGATTSLIVTHPGYDTCCKLCLRTQGEGHDEMCSRINIKVKSSFDRTGKKLPRPLAKNTDEEQCARNPAVRTEYRSLGDKKKDEEPDTSTAASSSSAVGTESKSRGHSSERQAPFRSASRHQPSGAATEGGDSLGCFPNPESKIQKSSLASTIEAN